ncbi:MAG: hypothetical protein BGO14_10690 [Chlamydiales bacterium 38-26]|nr:MAG: hypothetical protein BGO14_10690 [Chlamydiales bacterium 38-26]
MMMTIFLPLCILAASIKEDTLETESEKIREKSQRLAKLYQLEGEERLDITQRVLDSPEVLETHKEYIRSSGRRIWIFQYPSDGLLVTGYISFIPESKDPPLIMQFRGGNKQFGIPNPANNLTTYKNYTVVGSTLRGCFDEGVDEFGGKDVNDIKNLIEFFPILEQHLHISLVNQELQMIAYSRGGMEMFLALARFPGIQTKVGKLVSLSGLLDIERSIENRVDMKEMFEKEFGLTEDNWSEWIRERNPLWHVDKIRKDLPIMIIQGTADVRVSLEEGYEMMRVLGESGHQANYVEIDGGDHCLRNQPYILDLVDDWLHKCPL